MPFYLYKSVWNSDEDFLHIAEKRWGRRTDTLQTIKVYTNLPEADLTVNGKFVGSGENMGGRIVWEAIDLERGTNTIEVSSRGITERTTVEIPHSYSSDL